jgi:hypothetical protein
VKYSNICDEMYIEPKTSPDRHLLTCHLSVNTDHARMRVHVHCSFLAYTLTYLTCSFPTLSSYRSLTILYPPSFGHTLVQHAQYNTPNSRTPTPTMGNTIHGYPSALRSPSGGMNGTSARKTLAARYTMEIGRYVCHGDSQRSRLLNCR